MHWGLNLKGLVLAFHAGLVRRLCFEFGLGCLELWQAATKTVAHLAALRLWGRNSRSRMENNEQHMEEPDNRSQRCRRSACFLARLPGPGAYPLLQTLPGSLCLNLCRTSPRHIRGLLEELAVVPHSVSLPSNLIIPHPYKPQSTYTGGTSLDQTEEVGQGIDLYFDPAPAKHVLDMRWPTGPKRLLLSSFSNPMRTSDGMPDLKGAQHNSRKHVCCSQAVRPRLRHSLVALCNSFTSAVSKDPGT